MREIIVTPSAPSSPAYSQGIKVGDHIYVSGTVGIDVSTGLVAGTTVQQQTRQALTNCGEILRAGGATLADVVEVGVLLADPEDFQGMNETYREVFAVEPPARYVAKLGAVIPGVLVSIRMIAVIERT